MKSNKSKWVRNLIIGESNFIESYGEYKQAILSGQLALLSIPLILFYLTIDIVHGVYFTTPVFVLALFLVVLSIFMHRQGEHCMANYFMLPTLNVLVYLLAASESPNTGAFVFFIAVAVAGFAVFNYKYRIFSVIFAVFTYFLFVMAYFVDFNLLPSRDYSQDILLMNTVINFSIALPATVMSISFMISLNHHNTLQLVKSNSELVKTNNELDRFVYSTSHDLRAPLTSLLGLISITERTDNPEEVKRYIGMMRERVNSLDKFIRDITDYSRNNRLQVRNEPVKLAEITSEIWENLRFAPEAEGIRFETDIDDNVMLVTDRNRLKVVLGNLMSNAVRYHDLRKAEPFIRLSAEVYEKTFVLKVQDNGQGIDPQYQGKVFEMFYRANESSKGSGLGLYIVKEALIKMAGSIQLQSAPGEGTTLP